MKNNIDDNRFSYIFDLVTDESTSLPNDLTEEERQEYEDVKTLLDLIDTSWEMVETDYKNVRNLFLQKLAQQDPNHPWIRSNIVQTLGDLVTKGNLDIPGLTQENLDELRIDLTPIESLLEPKERSKSFGVALQRANVPSSAIVACVRWLSEAMSEIIPAFGTNRKELIFTRQQRNSNVDKQQ